MKFKILTGLMMLLLTLPALGHEGLTVLIDGVPLSKAEINRVRAVQVIQEISRPASCELEFQQSPGPPPGRFFEVGSALEVQVGEAQSIFRGEIVAVEPTFVSGGESRVVIRGFDKLHRLTRGRRTRTWQQVSDSDLVTTIAEQYGLGTEVEDPGIRYPFVLQNNQTDLQFLRQRAARIGYQLEMDGDVLLFRNAVPAPSTLVELKQFRPDKLSDRDQPGPLRVVVKGWDPAKKKEFVGQAEADTNQEGPGETYFFEWSDELSEEPQNQQFLIFSVQELELLTAAQIQRLFRRSRMVEGLAAGDANIRAGRQMNLPGLGDRFSGAYYVERATHQIKQGGYKTRVRLSREAEGTDKRPN